MHKLIIIIAISLLLTSCGFKLRNSDNLPPQLHNLAIITPNPDSRFSHELTDLLTSLHVNVITTGKSAPLQLKISNYSFIHNYPELTSADTIISYTFSLTITASILDNAGKTKVPAHTFSISQVITQAASPTYLANGPPNIEPEMRQNILSQIFYWLTSSNTKNALNHKV